MAAGSIGFFIESGSVRELVLILVGFFVYLLGVLKYELSTTAE